eukprot:8734619-Alexandrium_andersonii.AAC.1
MCIRDSFSFPRCRHDDYDMRVAEEVAHVGRNLPIRSEDMPLSCEARLKLGQLHDVDVAHCRDPALSLRQALGSV